jgi:hypothetical protein
MKNRPPPAKQWISISSADGNHHGVYSVSGGELTVTIGDRSKTVRASSTSVPAPYGPKADEALAKVVLSELVNSKK